MIHTGNAAAGRFCWVDLAATDAEEAKVFYSRLFGWNSCEVQVNGGSFTRLQLAGQDVASIYQLQRKHLERGVPSHWTPYIRVDDVNDAARRVTSLGGQTIVSPFVVCGIARIALILDSVGGLVGLWEPLSAHMDATVT
jgi:predicted enzyme related to lactoylglutathione lyase